MPNIFDQDSDRILPSIGDVTPYLNQVRYAIDPDMPASVPYKYVKNVLGQKTYKTSQISTGIPEEMTQPEKDIVDADELASTKSNHKILLQLSADAYVDSRYPNSSATKLSSLYTEAVRDRPNRASYILPFIKWREKVYADLKTRFDEVDAASSISAVNAIQLDTATLDSEDPQLTVEAAVAVEDSQDLSNFLDTNAIVTDPYTGVSGPFLSMQVLENRREIFNDSENPLYVADHGAILPIHQKLGWHRQEVFEQGWSRPKDILFYYGYPNSFNSLVNAWTNEKVAQDMAKYGIVVLGDGVQDPGHADYANTSVIVPRVKALNPAALIFGYVSLNQSQANFETKVGQWETLQVHGIFIDEAGYDYGKNRAEFNTAVDYVHGRIYAKLAFANAWNTDHILGTADDASYPNSTFNPTEVESKLTIDDWILLESLAVNTTAYSGSGGYAPKSDWAARVVKAQALRATYGVNFASVGIVNDDNANGQDLFDFTFVSALMVPLEANGTSSVSYGANTAQVKHWTRPNTTEIGEAWNLNASIQLDVGDADVYHRYTEFAKLSLDFSAGAQTSSIVKS